MTHCRVTTRPPRIARSSVQVHIFTTSRDSHIYHAIVTHSFQVGDVTIGGGALFLIAGPCVIESETHALKMAAAIAAIAREKKLPYIFKASYDKANRTSIRSFRGPGLEEGLRILREVREKVEVPVLTDVHETVDVLRVVQAVDILQIPAFLCRQTDLLVAAGESGRAVNIKKGQFVSPWDMQHAVEKVREAGGERVFLTERGASFGYNNLVVDMRGLKIMRDMGRRGRAILMVSSDLPEIIGVSDRILVMREGTLAGELAGGATEEEVMAIAVAHDREPHAMAS